MSGPDDAAARVGRAYRRERARAGGRWSAYVSLVGPDRPAVVLDDDADRVVHGYSVQKVAVAVAVLDRVDRGLLSLDTRVRLTGDLVLGGTGSYHLQPVWGDELTVANVLTAMLLVSDNTAVRLCGRLVPAADINEALAGKGLVHTRVEPAADRHRFWLGVTTAREAADLFRRLAAGTLLATASGDFLLRVLRAAGGCCDGIRRDMSSAQRARVAGKAGAHFDERGAARHEVGVMFDRAGVPALTFALFADALGAVDDYGGTHPAVRAHAALGPVLLAETDAPSDAVPSDAS